MDVAHKFRKRLIIQFTRTLLPYGFKGEKNGKGHVWYKPIEDGDFVIGIGASFINKNVGSHYFRLDQLIDCKDVNDIRAYSRSDWPPKDVRKMIGIKRSPSDILAGLGADVWIEVPHLIPTNEAFNQYAMWLKNQLEVNVPKGKKVVKKTHRWEI